MKTLGQDLRGALRLVTGNPGFATAVVVTFAIGIGANTAIFSFVHALLLRPLPFREAERLVWVRSIRGGEVGRLSRPELEDVKRLAAFEDAAGFHNAEYNLAEGGAPEALAATLTTANLFELLGVELLYGETWPESHDRTRQFSIVLNHGLWRRRFGGDPAVVGTSITLANAPGYTIVGILPPGFTFPTDVDLFRSIGISPDPMSYENRESRGVLVIARLAPDVSYARARAELSELAARLERSFPESNAGITFALQPLRDAFVGDVRPYLLLLTGAAGFVLLMAATNVVNLLLSRGAARSHELALRRALGASRGRLARQLVVESLVLALAGGAFGCVLAWGLVRAVDDTLRIDLPFWLNVELSFPVLAFTIVVSIAAGVLAGAAPALSTRLDSQDGLKDGVRGATSGRSAGQLRRVLVASQIAFALVLLAGAGLMVRTFIELQRVDLGFNPENLLTLRVDPPWNKYGNLETITPFYRAVLSELQSIPGVEAAATNQYLPLPANQQQEAVHEVVFTLEGQSPVEQQENPFAKLQLVSPSY
ncbi:MAG TPA: ABC transporter permease, partial [Vicinamibacteria bacterium]